MTTHPVMRAYLSALSAHTGPGMAPLPLAACTDMLGLDGLGLLLSPTDHPAELVQAHGERTAALEDLQQVQGQGPSLDAARHANMLLLPDIGELAADRWPGLPAAIEALDVHAVFCFPLRIGVIALGVLTGHRTRPGPMDPDQLTNALGLVNILAQIIITTAARPDQAQLALLDEPGLHFAEVHQATGMLAAQLGIHPDQALIQLRGYAFSHSHPLLDVARDILARRLHLNPDSDPLP
ncbi:ANTAR domain-containing protein [Streptomyces sp. NPDC127119]|uniref:ANTAR domain-containing protein n=1 Tax=Streptomyces sp. NPDC127119 TaxID=3345370 RepID=UPI003641BA23